MRTIPPTRNIAHLKRAENDSALKLPPLHAIQYIIDFIQGFLLDVCLNLSLGSYIQAFLQIQPAEQIMSERSGNQRDNMNMPASDD